MTPLTVWTNHSFDESHTDLLRRGIGQHRLIVAGNRSKSNLAGGSRDPLALEADILYGQPSIEDILESSRVKWVQLTTAGYTRYDDKAFLDAARSRNIAFCNASALYDEPCAQHAIAMLMAVSRVLPKAVIEQQQKHWNYLPLRSQSFLLQGQRVAIVGYGAIARRLVELLAPYRLEVTAFRRSVRGDENCPTLPIDQLDARLPETDIVINILPLSGSTKNFFSADRIQRFRKGTIYLNIGRGDTNDQDALVASLQSGQLAHAYLDVTSPEPLPKEHPLWTAPNAYITPHTAGGTFDEPKRMIEHFLTNLRRWEKGEPLINRIV